jgi:putative zinc finger protein
MSCEHLRAAIGAYALGALDPDEAAAVRRHLETCAECAAELDALAPLPGLLSLAGGAEEAVEKPLSPAFEERLLDAFARDRAASPRRRRLRWRVPRRRWLAAGAAGVAAVAAALVGLELGAEEEPALRYEITFQNVSAPAAASARANLESDDEGTEVHLWVRGLPSEEAVYEVLCDAEEWTATAGTFRTDAEGRAYVVLTTALRKSEYNAIRIVRRGHRKDGTLYKRDVLTAKLS